MLDRAVLEELIAKVSLAPSVHNIQPTRWRLDGDELILLEDVGRRLPAADPSGHDIRLSHGAAVEGLELALGRRGLRIARVDHISGAVAGNGLRGVARISVSPGGSADALAASVARRSTWRGSFQALDPAAHAALDRLAQVAEDLRLIRDPAAVGDIAALGDQAGFHFLCEDAHRHELLHWMRLSQRHPDYWRDGLNAEAMALGRIEALGASAVLGPLFPLLRRIGLAKTLTGEHGKTASGAIALFHRPTGEDPLESGRAFYRAWLALDVAGLAACPISVLADWPESNRRLSQHFRVPSERRLVNVFRLGIPRPGFRQAARARLPIGELVV